jgi:hypothetical protein
MATDPYSGFSTTPDSFGTRGTILTPGETDINPVPKAIVCLTAGNLTVLPFGNPDGETIAFVGVTAGFVPPFRVRRVTAANATVASIFD